MWNALPTHFKRIEDIRSFSTEPLHALNDDKLAISLYPSLLKMYLSNKIRLGIC